MTLLVTGGTQVDAGKTTFSTGLTAYTGGVGFKPRAGNDYWFHHDDYRRALESGTLYGGDAKRLADASPGQLHPVDVNPVHRLWTPAPGGPTGLLGREDRSFLLDRVGEGYVINGTVELPETARERLPLSDAVAVTSVEELNAAIQQYHLPALAALERTIARTDRAIVESYGDVARPIEGIEPEAVAVVEPRRVRLFDGSRFVKACSITTGGATPLQGQLEERVASVVELVDPLGERELPPLGETERDDPDAVATAYEPAYELLLDVAGWE